MRGNREQGIGNRDQGSGIRGQGKYLLSHISYLLPASPLPRFKVANISYLLSLISYLLSAASALAAPTPLDAALDAIRKAHSPSYQRFRHAAIVADMEAFGKTNDLTYAQSMTVARRIAEHAAALPDKSVFEKHFATLEACTNRQLKAAQLRSLIDAGIHTYSYNRAFGWETAMRILDAEADLFDANYRMAKRADLASLGLSVKRDRAAARYDELFQAVLDEPVPGGNATATNNFERTRAGRLRSMVQGLFVLGDDLALEQFEKVKERLSEGEQTAFLIELAKSYKNHNERAAFDAILARVRAFPPEKRTGPYCQMLNILHSFDGATANLLLQEALADKTMPPARRQAYLAKDRDFNTPPIWNYGFNSAGQYGRWRAIVREQLSIEDANPTNQACRVSNASWIPAAIGRAIWYDDLAFADDLIARYLAARPNDGETLGYRARVKAIRGDAKGAVEDLLARIGRPRLNTPAASNSAHRVIAFLEGRGLRGFDAVNKPLNLTDAQRLSALRKTSRELFNMRRYDDCRAIFAEITEKMYAPDITRIHTATYLADAPQSAGAFAARPDLYGDWDAMETRFTPYGDCYGESASVDEKRHLRSADQPLCNPDYRTGVRVIFDDAAVHVFIRCDDPAMDEVRLGQRDAGGLEMCFRAGDREKPYYSIFINNMPRTEDPHAVDWAMPGPGYRRNVDVFQKDAALTPDGVVAHLRIPWLDFYDSLPVDGNQWAIGIIRSGKGGTQSIGGVVHEISRGMRIKFNFSRDQLLALKRRVALMAFNRYNAVRRNEGAFIKSWNDKLLGDPAFYAAEVAPLLEKLDQAGKDLLAPCPDKAVEKYFKDFTPLWANIDFEIAARRTRYLNDRLFEE